MKYISMQEAYPGMKVARGLKDSYGRVLVGVGIPLTENYIGKLKEYGYPGAYICDGITDDIEVDDAISPELRMAGVESVKKQDVDGCMTVSKQMVVEILDKGVISLDLMDLRSYDDYTFAHSVNVAVISAIVAMAMGFNEEELEQIVLAGLLHDLGKLHMPTEILNKPGRLTPEEFDKIKEHPVISYELIKDRIDIPANVKNAVLFHHENVDGTGYPKGLQGDELTKFAKILHVADAYDALVSKRPYKDPFAPSETAEYMMACSGVLFDTDVVRTLLKYVPLYPKATNVRLSDGREGCVKENTMNHNLRPILIMTDGSELDLSLRENINLAIEPIEGAPLDIVEEQRRIQAFTKNAIKTSKVRIAIVDSNANNREALLNLLGDNYEMEMFATGKDFINYLKDGGKPHLVILDIRLKDVSGLEIAAKIKDMTKGSVPFMFITEIRDKRAIQIAKSINAQGYVLRPFDDNFMRTEVNRILARWGATH
ncbi:MAG: HD domain-containing protein [Lachnospiraceae bacterium]|nr:HD domain-containing protein [Lachnospiraceae bacterium]